MNFKDVLRDIEKLEGKKLKSIKPGAEITIKKINWDDGRVELVNAQGINQSRPFSELKVIWEQLIISPAIHVETVLQGTGSSRNQPETIFANLPYIEWLRIGKKHIAYIGQNTHDAGTLKQMDVMAVDKIKNALQQKSPLKLPTVVIITTDIRQTSENIEKITGLPSEALEMGVYKQEANDIKMLIVADNVLSEEIRPGTYPVIPTKSFPTNGISIRVAGLNFCAIKDKDINIFVFQNDSSI